MKKSKNKQIKSLNRIPKMRLIAGLIAIFIIASLGVYTLLSSFAASTGTISVKLVDTSGKPVPAGDGAINLAIVTPGTPLCSSMEELTDTDGQVNFNGCAVGVAYKVTFITFRGGWYEVAPGSQVNAGTQLSIDAGTQASITFGRVQLRDTDKDGVPDKTDSCVYAAGGGTANGCPAPAVPATPAAPASPAPSTPSNPKPPSSKTPASTPKKSTSSTSAKSTAPAVVAATSGDMSPPSAPENLIVSQVDEGTFLSWDDASDNVGVTGYNIDRSPDSENWSRIADNISDSFYTDTDVSPDNEYYYKVQAKDAAGNLSEGTVESIKVASNKPSDSSINKKSAAPAAKKSSTSVVAGISIAIILIIGLLIATFWVLKRKLQKSADPYSYDVTTINPPSMPTVTVMPGSSPSHMPHPPMAPTYNTGPPSEHTSVSLKEMVMEDMNRHGNNPQPPNPPTSR